MQANKQTALVKLGQIRGLGDVLYQSSGNLVELSAETLSCIGALIVDLAEEVIREVELPGKEKPQAA